MESKLTRQKFLEYFEKRGHKIVPSSSLVPDDHSVLLTTAGMQQFKPYFMGKADPMEDFGSKNITSIQKCFRASDIDEVGDDTHLTFFEMVGNFSFGSYFKKEAIAFSFELLTSKEEGLGLDPQKVFVTAFLGDSEVPRDNEAISLWQEQFRKVGIDEKIGERIFLYGRERNWWESGIGPAGPDAEMFYDRGLPHDTKFGQVCHPNCDCGRFVEIGNDVFIQYEKKTDGTYKPLAQNAIDNGRGFERLVTILQGKKNVFETDLFAPIIEFLPKDMPMRTKRIVADHSRGIAFLLSDGVRPSNKEAGYILRRLMRRVIVQWYLAAGGPDPARGREGTQRAFASDGVDKGEDIKKLLRKVVEMYRDFYSGLNADTICREFDIESRRFQKTLKSGLRELEKMQEIDAQSAFKLYESYGLPYEVVKEVAVEKTTELTRKDFDKEFAKHQEISRAGIKKKFGGHGLILDTGELKAGNEEELNKVLCLHTATHLLQQALREVLGPDVHQMGSDITAERTRFDFSFSRKMMQEEIKKVEDLVNEKIKDDLAVQFVELPKEEAIKIGALHFFKEKYPDKVKVYYVGKDLESAWSKEFCGGPHVKSTGDIGGIRISKEESVGAGVRRMRGILM